MDGREFLRCMRARDASVWDALAPLVRRIALGACRDLGIYEELKEDIAQDVVLRVFTRWQSYELQCALTTWVYAIARNRCLDELRRRSVRRETAAAGALRSEGGGDGSGPAPLEAAAAWNIEQSLCVQQVMAELDAQPAARKGSHRIADVLLWCVENSPSTEELAAFLQTTPAAAKERKSSILKRLKELCRKFCGHDDCSMAHPGARP